MALVRGTNSIGDVSEWIAFFVLADDEPVATFLEDVVGMATFRVLAQTAPVTVAGFDWRVDLQALPNPGHARDPQSGIPPESQVVTAIQDHLLNGFDWTTATPEARVVILGLDIDGRDVVIYLEAPDVGADASIREASSIVESLRPIR